MLAQAEHDTDACAILLTTSKRLATAVAKEVERQLAVLSTAPVARKSIAKNSAIVIVSSLDEAAELSNRFAPEHLSIHDESLIPKINHAGSIFVGPFSPEAAGDYAAGPNHVLPTSGAARLRGGLSVADYVKVISVQQLDPPRPRKTRARHHHPRPRRRPGSARPLRGGPPVTKTHKMPALPKGAVRPRPAVKAMAPYSPPTAGRTGKLRLDFNENTVGCSPSVIEASVESITPTASRSTPSTAKLKPPSLNIFRVPPEQFVFTNGTDEAIQVLINTYVDDDDEVVVLKPSYAMYRFYAEVAGARRSSKSPTSRRYGIPARSPARRHHPRNPRHPHLQPE